MNQLRLSLMLACLLCSTPLPAQHARMRTQSAAAGEWILEGDERVLFYQAATRSLDGQFSRAGYVHPLYDLHGNVVTEDFPADHPHHRGIFWAWHQCLVGGQPVGDGWACQDFQWQVEKMTTQSGRQWAGLEAHVRWSSPQLTDELGKPIPLVYERTQIRVHRRSGNYRVIDFDIQLNPLVADLQLGGSSDDKGYGGFSPRLVMPADPVFHGQRGSVEPERTAVDGGGWMTISDARQEQGVTIMCHRSLPGFPQKWILRKAGSMQNPVYPGRTAAALQIGQPWRLRYRLVLWHGGMTAEQTEQLYRKYNRSRPHPRT